MSFSYYMPTKFLFGEGTLSQLHNQTMPGKKALVVISQGTSTRKFGYLNKLEQELSLAKVEYIIFDQIQPNPTKNNVMDGAKIARKNNCDFIIGLGGGSSIDAAKSIAVMSTNEGDYWDYISGGTGKSKKVKNNPLPIIAITTTAGTGTEVDPWTVITNEKNNEKIGFGYEKTFPVLSIIDPELMLSVPSNLTAFQGFDALFHSTEGYINKTANIMSDMYAIKAIELIGKSLAIAVNNGNEKEARANVALANTLSGLVESTSGCISEHSIEHALSAFHPELPHGAGLIMISKAYYKFIADSGICDEKMIKMAKALGKENANKAIDFVEALGDLIEACGVSNLKISEFGIELKDLNEYAHNARETMGGLFEVDPLPVTHEDVVSILKNSFE